MSSSRKWWKSIFMAIGSIEIGLLNMENPSGNCVTPHGMPMMVVVMIVRNSAPFTFSFIRIAPSRMPAIASIAVGVRGSITVRFALSATIIFPFFSPM